MYTTHPVPGLRDGSFVALHQMAEHAWNRTFAERLEEAVRKYEDVDRDTLQRDLTIAWWNIEQIITSYDATS
jgi:hypothetical protein